MKKILIGSYMMLLLEWESSADIHPNKIYYFIVKTIS